ncbi:polysaccharide biosynthesis/export family protein [Echinicola jeungdonensis]|nr:polysaccharide biosynthesis/export family protein [Echinicola jeungdonensis]MDN3671146.1 polysaccharide biosynthesis/export family protein [Echinicola jeungdonensis]
MQDLEEKEPVIINEGNLVPYETEDYHLQYNDIVDVTIKTTSPEINDIFTFSAVSEQMRMMSGSLANSGDVFFLNGYTIDNQGNIELPMIGEIKLVGLTTKEAKELIGAKVKDYVKEDEAFVRVRLGGIRYSALGEFNRPGRYTMMQNRVTIYEAIANAGDLTTLAKRNSVNIIRQYPDGSKTHKINLNHKGLMASEFYFLKPNDLIYAEPMKVRELGTGVTFLQTFQLAITSLTAVLLVINATQ